MVRKRSRKYESDDSDNDSDLDFEVSQSQAPAPKKYSLRERKRAPLFTTDFDYYGLDEEDGEARKQSSDDEDFEVEPDAEGTRAFFEPDAEAPVSEGGLIDFEDIIRADIVVNKNKIDYDNVIQKTEITLTQPKRRGRKPRNPPPETEPPDEEAPTHTCEPDIQALAHLEGQESEEKDAMQSEINFCEQALICNGDASLEKILENGDSDKLINEADPMTIRNAAALNSPPLFVPPVENKVQGVEGNEGGSKTVEEEDDDVIVLGELKQPVIVLDD